MAKKKKKKRMKVPGYDGFTSKEIKMLIEANKHKPSKYKKLELLTFRCDDCKYVHYYRVKRCVICGCVKLEQLKNQT